MSSRYANFEEPVNTEIGIDQYKTYPLVSLQNALRNNLKSVKNLQSALANAKEQCTKSSHDLTENESAAIYLYTMEMSPASVYAIINDLLRDNEAMNAQSWFPYLKLLYTAVSKLPSYSGSVWRGVRGNVIQNYRKGMPVCWWSFTSCSTSLSVIQTFLPKKGQGTIFMIECVSGRRISNYSEHEDEDEILLMPGIRLVVTDILFHNDMYMVHLREIASNDESKKPKSAKPTVTLSQQLMKTNINSVSHDLLQHIPSGSPTVKLTIPSSAGISGPTNTKTTSGRDQLLKNSFN